MKQPALLESERDTAQIPELQPPPLLESEREPPQIHEYWQPLLEGEPAQIAQEGEPPARSQPVASLEGPGWPAQIATTKACA